MKKKTLFLVGLCAFGLCSWETQAFSTLPASITINKGDLEDPPAGYEKINLQGSLMYGINPNVIVAGASDDEVYIQFNQSLGNVNIAIFNSNGQQVYSTVVDTSIQQVVIIPFTNTAVDTYTIELSQANRYAEGEFERN